MTSVTFQMSYVICHISPVTKANSHKPSPCQHDHFAQYAGLQSPKNILNTRVIEKKNDKYVSLFSNISNRFFTQNSPDFLVQVVDGEDVIRHYTIYGRCNYYTDPA